ncbi:MAG: hypothetical protein GYA21_06580, partial [Myxococcales bacterium]|nr:hypothetical protein [Myxococcales bacterium]
MRRAGAILLLPVVWAASARAGVQVLDPAAGTIMGRVFWDRDGDGVFSTPDEPLAGVRVTCSSGDVATTDERGQYHFDDLPAGFEAFGDRVLKLDPATLPAGVAGPTRRFFSLAPKDLVRLDFPLLLRPAPALENEARLLDAGGGGGFVPAQDGSLGYVWSAAVPDGCRLSLGDELLEPGADGRVRKNLILHPGANRWLSILQCPEERVRFFLVDMVWVRRSQGGDLVVPARPRPIGSCRAPSPEMPRAASALVSCRMEEGVRLWLSGEPFEGASQVEKIVPIAPGENSWAVTVALPGADSFLARLSFEVATTGVSGALLGSFATTLDGDGGDVAFGGKLDGWVEARLPANFKLVLGGNYYSYDTEGQSFLGVFRDLLLPAFSPWRREHAPDLEDGTFEFADSSPVLVRNPSRARYYLEVSRQASILGVGQFEIAKASPGGAGTLDLFSYGVWAELHPVEWLSDSRVVDVTLEGFYGVPGPGAGQPLPPTEPEPGQLRPAAAHDEFAATGSTLYFLSHRWLSQGSLRLAVERRDRLTGAVLESRELRPNRDFRVDWEAGRVILFAPLDPGGGFREALLLHMLGSTRAVLVADYEYLDVDPALVSRSIAGGRAGVTSRFRDDIRIGGSVFGMTTAEADEGFDPYRLLSGEVFANLGTFARLRAAYGRSTGVIGEPNYSTDGGLSFHRPARGAHDEGEAYTADIEIDTSRVQARGGFARFLSGYADSARLTGEDITQAWLDGNVIVSDEVNIFTRGAGGYFHQGASVFGTLGASFRPMQKLSITAQAGVDLRRQEGEPGRGIGEGEGTRVLAGLQARYRALSWLGFVAGHQQNLWREGTGSAARDLTLTTVGIDLEGPGDIGVGIEGGFGPEVGNLVRLNLLREADGAGTFVRADFFPEAGLSGPRSLSSGQSASVGKGMLYRSAESYRLGSAQGTASRLGLGFPVTGGLWANLSWERGELADPAAFSSRADLGDAPFADRGVSSAVAPGRRNAIFGSLAFRSERLALRATAEYRIDEHAPLPEGLYPGRVSNLRQSLFSVAGRFVPTRGLAVSARAAFGEAFGEGAEGAGMMPLGGLLEASAGVAWRPEELDWIWLLARVSGGRDLRPELAREGRRAEMWWLGSLALHLRPSRYFQPSLVLAPVWESQPVEFPAGRRYLEAGSLLAMLRVG